MRRRALTILVILGALLSGAGCGKREEIKVRQVAKGEPQGPLPQNPQPEIAAPSTGTGIADEPPRDWQKQPPSPLRQLSYFVQDSGRARCEVSLVMLGGGAGGVMENVNRWRAQIGLKPLDESALAGESRHLSTRLGETTVVDMSGTPEKGDPLQDGRIIAVILPFGERTFFFKLRGNHDLAGRRKQEFLKWIDTVRIPQ